MKASRVIGGLIVAFATMGAAERGLSAREWLYCIAPSHAEHRIYMSPVFESDQPPGSVEAAYGAVLNRASKSYDDVQCPRSDDERSAALMQGHAVSFNRKLGNTIINLSWPSH